VGEGANVRRNNVKGLRIIRARTAAVAVAAAVARARDACDDETVEITTEHDREEHLENNSLSLDHKT
jgi:hypothetical protein